MATPGPVRPKESDWTKPAAMAIPKEGYFTLEQGRYGSIFPKTPVCHGFSVVAKVKDGREQARYKVNSLGFAANAILPGRKASVAVKYFHEFACRSTYQGFTLQISGAITF